ncbi:conserved Plasmodium protein, unknown function [Plasmodium knowlesi strain H]|uniref:Dynamin N-terminal domain-containing protein n=3 Tax=Plasmodium knowlesi TaxID=5850 RepID=A0A5E7X8F0_PLAKH|nr:uncharacterized protein PKNH_1438100 [Plasmodium knowlesi strain H]OTN63655.1 Uncharacterized protein PKNOH_S140256200 [Plasmodium knowlesi]CAA9990977.1 dynamin-like protein, putative [Plasmodium knowlesi strain H]SBO20775.1 conserved Plasmodium protein, unknown function [Plasmodium knowlesi strain H]SBO21222.1 conserved Plasmodium protein, unknown function [Plasmodium knowlesi strain H]VVS80451.1 dynamin-like protein, putative [Plasmodium knowlesi strain H]
MEYGNGGDKIFDLNSISREKLELVEVFYDKMKDTTNANALYLYALQIFKICNIHNELPRLVVFGQQSMGKTTLLDFIMGGPMGYTSSDTGTKQPIVIILKPSDTNKIECYLNKKKVSIDDLHEKMKAIMVNLNESIIPKELEVEISIPGGIYATFVDLPGIKDDSKAGSELTRKIVRNYVQNFPNDIYILVKKASDDPANWPYHLREFFMKPKPMGLGLQNKQCIVVGTRALEFLNNELSTIKTLTELYDRVKKRGIMDHNDNILSLYLLELFSIPIEQKEKNDFLTNRISMYSKILNGRKNVLDLLLNKFENDCNDSIKKELLDCFDVEKFKQEVNSKFMNILIQQLRKVEVKLEKKKSKMEFYNKKLEELYNKGNILSIREQVKLYIRELVNIVSNLLTGNYPILNLPNNGEDFLKKYGGTLMENLKDGNELAVELFEKQGLYDENFLNYLNEYLCKYASENDINQSISSESNYDINNILNNKDLHNNNGNNNNSSNKRADAYDTLNDMEKKKLNSVPALVEGQPVRFILAKEESSMFGVVQNTPTDAKSKNILVSFYFRNSNTEEQVQIKSVEKDRLTVIKAVETLNGDPSFLNGLQVWYKMIRDDGWVGFDKAEIIKVFNNNSKIKDVLIRNLSKNDEVISIKINDLYMDYVIDENKENEENEENEEMKENDDDILKRIAGAHTDLKILNQLAITYICKWLKYNIAKIEPEKDFSDEVLLQMMRSIHNIVDQSDWKPLVVDLLQANISGNILHLTKLASCSAAVALNRVFKAGLGEINRKIKNNYMDENIYLLSTNPKFLDELNQALHNFCKERAITCASEMKDIVFEQTYAVHFEIIEEIFDGCKLFEDNFLTPSGVKPTMSIITKNVKQNLAYRNHQLSLTDIKINKKSKSKELIQEEVKLQFWAIKMLISVPFATKIYAHFLNNILPKNKHLANVLDYSIDCESTLEKYIQSKLLNREVNGVMVPIDDKELMSHYNIIDNRDNLLRKLENQKRLNQYFTIVSNSIKLLKNNLSKESTLDFVTKLDFGQENKKNWHRLDSYED